MECLIQVDRTRDYLALFESKQIFHEQVLCTGTLVTEMRKAQVDKTLTTSLSPSSDTDS